MFLLHLPRDQSLNWVQTASHSSEHTPTYVYVLVLSLACIGGVLHGIAMGLRKKYGEGIEKYWLEWKWWVGCILDAFAGVMIWPAMPYISVQIFAPLVIVSQLGSSYLLGLFVFGEKCALNHNVGLSCAVAGVIGISMSTSHEAAGFTISQFWAGWVTIRFLSATVVILTLLATCFFTVHRSTFWALCAAYFEGIQYICSRSIVDCMFDHLLECLKQPAVFAALVLKVCCILGIIHTQQLGLEADLSRFAGIYLCGCTFFMCIYGSAFFGDDLPLSFTFFASAFFTLAGIWLLNQAKEDAAGELIKANSEASGKESDRAAAEA